MITIFDDEAGEPVKPYAIGDTFITESGDEILLLAQTAPQACALIGLCSGNRYEEVVRVENLKNISSAELSRMCGILIGKIRRVDLRIRYSFA